MQIIIATSNNYKLKELNKYFYNIGIKTHHANKYNHEKLAQSFTEYLCIMEKTKLINKHTKKNATLDKFEEVIHQSVVTVYLYKENRLTKKTFNAKVEGLIFPSLKSTRKGVYNWDDIFVSSYTMKTYQEMKDNNIKNSARDLAFSKMIDEMPELFQFNEKVNLKFNPVDHEETISFEPIIKNLFDNNKYYQIAYKNPLFKNIVNHIMNNGLFVRRARNRKEKNYWLPGLNAGIPLTPKKDELHELTFMFHDIMHFLYFDVIVTEKTEESKNKYILSRMMSEAFTLVLADMLFISLLKDSDIEYDYNKRKIYPLFENIKFEISKENIPLIKELLWSNVCFALLGEDEPLKSLVKNDTAFELYKHKYQRFFQEDYKWTANNFNNISKNYKTNQKWCKLFKKNNMDISNVEEYSLLNKNDNLRKQIEVVFDSMFSKLKNVIESNEEYNEQKAFTNAVKRYMTGQMLVFFKFETLYNELFLKEIIKVVKKDIISKGDLKTILELYNAYLTKLCEDNFISSYEMNGFKEIYPNFDPFYVFYDKEKNEDFKQTLSDIFKGITI